jgi:hypothetical protein
MDLTTQTRNIMAKAIKNFADEGKVDNTEIQILISTDDEENCTPKYQVLKKNKPFKEITFNDILNVKVDFLGREMIASPFIANTIKRLAKEQECVNLDINVLIYTHDSKAEDILLYVFKKTEPLKKLTFEYLFEGM